MARGFSLFEMVIVMGIIGLILGGAIYTMGGIKNTAAIKTAQSDMGSFKTSLDSYELLAGNYPSTEQGLEALYKRPTGSPRPKQWTQIVTSEDALLDPWKTKYKYELGDNRVPVITSAGPDREFGGEDDISTED